MNQALHTLIVEDSENDALLLVHELRRGNYRVSYRVVKTPADMEAALRKNHWDIIISDHSMPGFSSREALHLARSVNPDTPFIIVSGAIGEEEAAHIMKYGAHDYIMKNNLTRLLPSIERELQEAESRRKYRAAEKALQDKDTRFRIFFEEATLAMIMIEHRLPLETKGQIIEYNPAAQRFFGYSAAELKQMTIASLTHPEDLYKDSAGLAALEKGAHHSYNIEKRFIRKDGRVVWGNWSFTQIRDEKGAPIWGLATIVDTSAQKQATENLQLFRSLIDHTNDAVFVIDPRSLSFLDINDTACAMYGYSRNELLSLPLNSLLTKKLSPRQWRNNLEKLRRKGSLFLQIMSRRRDGGAFPVEININYISLKDRSFLVGVARDVSERKKIEKELRKSLKNTLRIKGEWENTFDNISELVVLINGNKRIIRGNKSFADFMGKPSSDLLGKKCCDYIMCDREIMQQCGDKVKIGRTSAIKNSTTHKKHWFQINCHPIFNHRGKFSHSLIVCTDITDLKKTAQKLMKSEGELKTRVEELEKFYEMAVNRELRMKELKADLKKHKTELAQYRK